MTICTFIGDYNAPKSIQERLKAALPELVRKYGVDFFYVGNEGNFSMMAEDCLYQLCRIYANVGFKAIECDSTKKVFGKKSKEYKRDRCLVKESQYVLAYAGDDSNAYGLIKYAERKGKTVLNLYSDI